MTYLKPQPILLIDVDGVISLFGFPEDRRPPGRFASVDGLPHYLHEQAGNWIDRLAESFDCVWCTGWEDRAPEHLGHLLGLRSAPFPYVVFDGTTPLPRAHWKLAAIDAHAGRDRPLAWIDDAHDDRTRAWAVERPGATLLVETDAAVGLTEPDVVRLEGWAARL